MKEIHSGRYIAFKDKPKENQSTAEKATSMLVGTDYCRSFNHTGLETAVKFQFYCDFFLCFYIH